MRSEERDVLKIVCRMQVDDGMVVPSQSWPFEMSKGWFCWRRKVLEDFCGQDGIDSCGI